MNFLDKFASKRRNVIIYAAIKVSIAGYMLYLFFQTEDMAIKIIFLATIFILLMAMAPVLLIHFMVKKQNQKRGQSENKDISKE